MKSKFVRIGILIIISSVILIWGLSYLQGNDIFRRSNEYHVIYESVDGLSQSNNVLLSGYKIGQVSNIKFLDDNSGRLLVSIMVDSSIKIPRNSVAQIVSSDIMGTRSIKIELSDMNVYHNDNDTLRGSIEADLKEQVSMQVLPLKNKAEELLSTLDSAITGLAFIFDENAQRNWSESFENINRTMSNLERTTADLQELISLEKENISDVINNLATITNTFSQNAPELDNAIANLSSFSDTLSQLQFTPLMNNVTTASNQLNEVLAQLNSTDNTLGNLLNSDELYGSLNQLSQNLNLLMNDIRVNPDRYLNLSAVDLGRNVYINALEGESDKIEFKIHLVSSQKKIPLDSKYFEGLKPVEEYTISGAYTYLYGVTHSFSEALELQKEAQKNFPDATVVAFRNGRLIKLERALKTIK